MVARTICLHRPSHCHRLARYSRSHDTRFDRVELGLVLSPTKMGRQSAIWRRVVCCAAIDVKSVVVGWEAARGRDC